MKCEHWQHWTIYCRFQVNVAKAISHVALQDTHPCTVSRVGQRSKLSRTESFPLQNFYTECKLIKYTYMYKYDSSLMHALILGSSAQHVVELSCPLTAATDSPAFADVQLLPLNTPNLTFIEVGGGVTQARSRHAVSAMHIMLTSLVVPREITGGCWN